MRKEGFNCQFVSSESVNRKEIVENFRKGTLQFIITTTILERVTVPHVTSVSILRMMIFLMNVRSFKLLAERDGRTPPMLM